MTVATLRAIRVAAWVAVVAVAAIAVWLAVVNKPAEVEGGVATATIGGPFELTDQTGRAVTEAALQGHPSALFFGYTFCPDVCPTTLADITLWLRDLGEAGDALKVYFITVDPERDTEEQMARYLQAFDPRIVGLTGSQTAIDQVIAAYRVYARKVEVEGGGPYLMDHTAAVYLLDSDAQFAGTVDYGEDRESVLTKLTRLIERS